ncbi:hypothetical protein CGSMWGv1400E_03506 [Gardnerella vaginalis 1400E]|uniref:Uncharacterized protein n=1 Tax=Gardnerella vaginalis 1400E TaxID=698956 RepID=I4LW76_GARVA|nr:hypothetical protein CGSMWGv1400E_03506 [Gardnerella vaginalis 1400E]
MHSPNSYAHMLISRKIFLKPQTNAEKISCLILH